MLRVKEKQNHQIFILMGNMTLNGKQNGKEKNKIINVPFMGSSLVLIDTQKLINFPITKYPEVFYSSIGCCDCCSENSLILLQLLQNL